MDICHLCKRNPISDKALAAYHKLCSDCENRTNWPPEKTASKLIDQGIIKLKEIQRRPPEPIKLYRQPDDVTYTRAKPEEIRLATKVVLEQFGDVIKGLSDK